GRRGDPSWTVVIPSVLIAIRSVVCARRVVFSLQAPLLQIAASPTLNREQDESIDINSDYREDTGDETKEESFREDIEDE
ncbi:hypothetical protein KI387_034407, partial [Taxus chinensis]